MNHFRFAVICMLWICSGSVSAQWIYSQGFAAMTGTPELQRINLANHTLVRLVGMGDMGDIAFHPDQRLFGVVFDKVYLLDTVTSAYTEIYDIGDFQSVGMTIDYRGMMYFSGYNPNTNRYGIAVYNPVTSTTRIIADFGPINQGFINDLEFYNGQLYVVGELPSIFAEQAVLFRVDTSGLNQHDTIVQYNLWPGRALASVNDTCGSQFLVSPTTDLLNYFYPPLDSVRAYGMMLPDGLFYSSGATSRTSHLGSIPVLKISGIDISQDPCIGNSNASVVIFMQESRSAFIQYSLDGINYQDHNLFTNVLPGQYQIFVRDDWGCNIMGSFEILDIPPFPVSIKVIAATCSQDNGTISVHSALSGLQYALDNYVFSEDSVFTNLAGGNHSIVIRNDAGCVDTIQVNVDFYPAPTFEVMLKDEQCHAANGVIEFINVTGEGPLQFSLNGAVWQDQNIFENMSAGLYTIFLRDRFNCTIQETVTLDETGKPEIVNGQVIAEECGEADGRIELTVDSEHGPILYSLNGGTWNNMSFFDHLIAGIYTASVKDTFGCVSETQIEVPGIGGPVIDVLQLTPEYCGKSNGHIVISATSAHGPLEYSIAHGPFTIYSEFNDLTQGQYHIIIQDTNGCQYQTDVFIDGIHRIGIDSVYAEDATCELENGSLIIISDSSSFEEYSLDGKFFQAEPYFENLKPRMYTSYLRSFGVCMDSVSLTIGEHTNPVIDDLILVQPTCKGAPAMITVTGHGESELQYVLDHDISNSSGQFTGLSEGNHEVIITDQFGCHVDTTFAIVREKCSFYIPNVFTPNGDGVNDIFSVLTEEKLVQMKLFEIYDRWGNKVFNCEGYKVCEWDGNIYGLAAQEGVYLYQLSFMDMNGSHFSAGQVTLLR